MIIGSGQLAQMICEESYNINQHINHIYIYTNSENTPCSYLDFEKLNYITIHIGEYNDFNKIKEISDKCHYITYEFEGFDTKIFEHILIKNKIFPSLDILKIIQDKYNQKLFIFDNIKDINVGNFKIINSYQDIINFINIYDFPVFLKSRFGAFDGRGNYLIQNEIDLNNFKNIKPDTYFIENFINFDKEVSICGCINSNNDFMHYDIVKNIHKNSILVKTIFPDNNLKENVKEKIINTLKNILQLFNTKGIICIELFIKDDEIYYNELCIRVHNSMHHTLNSNKTSQFENHLRSIFELNLGKNEPLFNGSFYNIISNLQEIENIKVFENLQKKHYIKMYNKKNIGIRKVGHIVVENNLL